VGRRELISLWESKNRDRNEVGDMRETRMDRRASVHPMLAVIHRLSP
jgi:hypothetical protein